MYAVSPSGSDVLEHDVDLDRTGGVDLHLAADEVPREARREHVDVILPRRHDDLESAGSVGGGGRLDRPRIAEVDRRADRGKTALVLDRAPHGHAASEHEIDLRAAGSETHRIRFDPVVLVTPVLGD